MLKALIINQVDNVATATADIKPGEIVSLTVRGEMKKIKVGEEIPFGHKFALRKIERGESVTKYGEQIGKAIKVIESGFHVHIHNVESLRGRGDLKRT